MYKEFSRQQGEIFLFVRLNDILMMNTIIHDQYSILFLVQHIEVLLH
jgi:hypothetical protein